MEQRKLEYIKKIAKNLGPKCEFDIYDKDDIEQETYFLVCQAESIYDPEKGDEYTFYFNYVKNRLSTLKRDKYGVSKFKMQIADAVTLEGDIIEPDEDILGPYRDIVDEKIPNNLRGDYLRFLEGIKIPHRDKLLLTEAVTEIIRLYRLEQDG